MTQDMFIDALGCIDQDLLDQYALDEIRFTARKRRRMPVWGKLLIAAACLMLVFSITVGSLPVMYVFNKQEIDRFVSDTVDRVVFPLEGEQEGEIDREIKALEEANKALEDEVAVLRNVKPLNVSESIFFEFGSSKIASKKDELNIKAYADAAKAVGAKVKVVGFADVIGATDFNLKLSQARAEAVAEILRANGAEVESVVGYGESEEYRERFLNRRAVISVAE